MQIVGCRHDTGQAVVIDVQGETISRISPFGGDGRLAADRPGDLPWIAPGFVDVQINGYGGQEFSDPGLTEEKVAGINTVLDGWGVTSYCPTVTTQHVGVLAHAMGIIASACRSMPEVARRVAGIHLEGPYLSAEDGPRGAHPVDHCRSHDWDEFQRLQQAADGRIRLLTLSPEFDDSARFIAKVVAGGVVVAIGHTAANSDQIRAAVDAGARLSTHLGNGAHRQLRRHPNYLWDQLAEDRMLASLIVDGHHLPAEVVKTFVRAKTPHRCILVSDVSGLAGLPVGIHETSLGRMEVLDDGRLVIAGQRQLLAGAALPIGAGVANVIRFAGVDLKTAVAMASGRPAELIGCPPCELKVGCPADLVQFDLPGKDLPDGPHQLEVRATVKSGEVVFGSLWCGA